MAAMGTAADGDTVLVAPGVYTEIVLVKDGVCLISEAGAEATTFAFDTTSTAESNPGAAVVTFGKCTTSTQLVGFSIDGRGKATRGILAIGNATPVISDCRITGAESGLGAHRGAAPYMVGTRIEGCGVAGVFVQGGSADIRQCEIADSPMFGVLVQGTTRPVRLLDNTIRGNEQCGVRATEGELTVSGGTISGNTGSGLDAEFVAPVLEGVVFEDNPNVGLLLHGSNATVRGCTFRRNNFGLVASESGSPQVFRSMFEDNRSCHLSVEGEATPLVGGSLGESNLFLGTAGAAIQTTSPYVVNATFNYWGKPCPSRDQVKRGPGARDAARKPWVTADLAHAYSSCEEARHGCETAPGAGGQVADANPSQEREAHAQ